METRKKKSLNRPTKVPSRSYKHCCMMTISLAQEEELRSGSQALATGSLEIQSLNETHRTKRKSDAGTGTSVIPLLTNCGTETINFDLRNTW